MLRNCDNCGNEYEAKEADINRGWGLTCSKSCAAEKREKNKPDYNASQVRINNMKRELWDNKYRNQERILRKKNPKWNDEKIWEEMFKLTKDIIFLSKEARDIFIF